MSGGTPRQPEGEERDRGGGHEAEAPPEVLSFADGITRPREYTRLGPAVWVFGGLIFATAIVTLVLMLRDFSSRSYLYLAFYAIPANSAISVFPHEPVVIFFGKHGSVWWTAVAASAGTLVAGFLDHSVFVPVLNLQSLKGYKDKAWYRKAAGFFMRYPFATLVVTGFTPIPFFPFKFLSFSVHFPRWKYLSALLVGRFPRYVVLASVGHFLAIPNWALFGFFGVIIVIYAWKAGPKALAELRRRRRRRAAARSGAGRAGTGEGPAGEGGPGPAGGEPR